ncbi:MAG: 16S rRNA (cytidine(1402)-2'-O)-methyltransferase [Clostridia bacterium]|nr:16S rRNA (cytidine(1402)-2'-O)-methyltransferase [Clostridia bacterium]
MNKGTLYLCATPIGNLEDISVRTLNTLKEVDLIACEDTRHSLRLLNHFDISKPLTSYHEHNKQEKGAQLIKQLLDGTNIALVSDAGTPAISDPGEDLVKKCIEADIRVVPIPGPAALICALVASGQSTGRFTFEGFLSMNRKNRLEHLESLVDEQRTMIFYEAPHKLTRTLADMFKYFGDRDITLVKEITKIHESVTKTTLAKAVEYYTDNIPKGEFVLVLAGKSSGELAAEIQAEFAHMSVVEHVNSLIAQGTDKKEAIKEVAKLRGIPKRDVYNQYINKES